MQEAKYKRRAMTGPGEIPRLAATAETAEVVAAIEAAGCVVVDNLVGANIMDALDHDLTPAFDGRWFGVDDFAGYQTKRVSGLMALSRTARDLALNPLALEAAETLLKPHCKAIQLHVTHAVGIGPGEIAQVMHRDDGLWEMAHPKPRLSLHCMWAMTDFTAENGGTRLVPGSHLWPIDREPRNHEIRSTVMARGSVAFYDGRTRHGGGANHSGAPRIGMLLGYLVGWLRQEENQYLSAPPEIAKTFPDRLQRLIGYDLHGEHLGWIDAGNPHRLLEDDPEDQSRVF